MASFNRRSSAENVAKLTEKLTDENLMQRYGTSLGQINMGREYQKYLDEKYHTLKTEFEKINKNPNDGVTIDEFVDYFNTFKSDSNKEYSHEYIEKLFNLIDIDQNKEITIQEFILAYMQLEEKLRLKKIKLQKIHDDLKLLRDKYQKGINENKGEIINRNGISTSAVLNVSLIEAKNLRPLDYNGFSDPYAVLILENNKQTSTYKPDTLEPIWNEDFSL